jgi:hypothetical protein
MNVVEFPVAIARGNDRSGWQHSELQQLIGLCASRYARNSGSARELPVEENWAVDSTEAGDPQFYVLGNGPDAECLLCISRVRRTYLLEDGNGAVLAESRTLAPIVNHAKRSLAGRGMGAVVVRMFMVLCAIRLTVEEKIDAVLPDSVDVLTRFAPELHMIL